MIPRDKGKSIFHDLINAFYAEIEPTPTAYKADLIKALTLLEDYARHDVTLVCNACGASFGYDHTPDCEIGKLIAKLKETK